MDNKNTIAATLSVLALLGFLIVFGWIATHEIPAANKDYFNTALIALIGFVGTGIGYYLGSSKSSSDKNVLLDKAITPDPPATAATIPATPLKPLEPLATENGFIRCQIPLFIAMCGLVAFTLFAGCATTKPTDPPSVSDSPQVVAGKTLLAVKSTITVAATAVDRLCDNNMLTVDQCIQTQKAYEKAKPAYDAAVDAYLLLTTGVGDTGQFSAAMERLRPLADDLLKLSGGAQ